MEQLIRRGSTLFPIALLLLAMASFQSGASIAKTMFPIVGAAGMVTIRILFGTIVLVFALRPWRARITAASWRPLAVYGVSLGVMNLFFYSALSRVPLGIAVALEFSGPLAVAVFASRRRMDFFWVVLASAGLLLLLPIAHLSAGIDPLGVVYALAAGGCWALYIIFGQKAGADHGAQTVALGSVISAILVAPIGLVTAGAALLSRSVLLPGLAVGVLFNGSALYAGDDRADALAHTDVRRTDEPGAGLRRLLRAGVPARAAEHRAMDRDRADHRGFDRDDGNV